MPVDVTIDPKIAGELKALARKLKAGDQVNLRRELTKGLRAGVKPVAAALKARALGLPSHTGGTLRAAIAKAVTIQVRTGGKSPGIRLRIPNAKMGDRAALPRLMNRGTWRHPVFGSDTWVEQTSETNWWDDTAKAGRSSVVTEIRHVLDDIERKSRIR